MNKPMSDSYKKEVEDFKEWSHNSSDRINDSKSGASPRPRYKRLHEPPMSPALKDIIDNTFNHASNRRK